VMKVMKVIWIMRYDREEESPIYHRQHKASMLPTFLRQNFGRQEDCLPYEIATTAQGLLSYKTNSLSLRCREQCCCLLLATMGMSHGSLCYKAVQACLDDDQSPIVFRDSTFAPTWTC
jgi:hypothetical protein